MNPPQGFSVRPDDDNEFKWNAVLVGPADSPYEGGQFKLDIQFPMDYPNKPMRVKFETHIFHPNINWNGEINLDVLADTWSPDLDARIILYNIE